MASTGGQQPVNLIPRRWSLFQALRHAPPGPMGDARLETRASFAFEPLAMPAPTKGGPLTLPVSYLTGRTGVLPRPISEFLISRADLQRDGRPCPELAFFDLFNAYLVKLEYAALLRSRMHVRIEQADPTGPVALLGAMAGMGLGGFPETLPPPRAGLGCDQAAFFAGLLGQVPRSAQALGQVLGDLLGAPVEMRQNDGVWLTIPPAQRYTLPTGPGCDPSAALGGILVGDRIWDRASSLRIRIGPLSWPEFRALIPTPAGPSARMRAVQEILVQGLGRLPQRRLQLVLRGDAVPPLCLGSDAACLGVSSWLARRDPGHDADDTLIAA